MNKLKCSFWGLASVFCLALFGGLRSQAQGLQVDESAPVKNLKVLSEESDGKGHITRIVQYSKGNIRITETIFITKGPSIRELIVYAFKWLKIQVVGLAADSFNFYDGRFRAGFGCGYLGNCAGNSAKGYDS